MTTWSRMKPCLCIKPLNPKQTAKCKNTWITATGNVVAPITTLEETSAQVVNPQQMSNILLHFSSWHRDFSSSFFFCRVSVFTPNIAHLEISLTCALLIEIHTDKNPLGAHARFNVTNYCDESFVCFKPQLPHQSPKTCTLVFRESTCTVLFISGPQENQKSLVQHII